MTDGLHDDGHHGRGFDELVQEALAAPVEGWDFSWLDGRSDGEKLTWDYVELARDELSSASRVLDIDTGGGEMLASLAPRPGTIATEPHQPNVGVARARLAPIGVDVRAVTGPTLPVADGEVDLVLNRHGSFDVAEIDRVLAPGGVLLSQQVGSANDLEFNDALGLPPAVDTGAHTLETAVAALDAAGLTVTEAAEQFPVTHYRDIGAVVYQLRVVSWQVPGFDVERLEERLRDIDARTRESGSFPVRSHRFLVRATKF